MLCFCWLYYGKNNTSLLQDKIISEEEFLNLKNLGAIGEINGSCFDIQGNTIETNDDFFSTTHLCTIKEINLWWLFARGSYKASALKGAIKGKLVNGLIIDELTARKMLN